MKTLFFSLALGLLTCFSTTYAQSGTAEKAGSAKKTSAPATKNIVETAASAGSFKTLLTAAKAAGLAEPLSTGEYTVFAPTDEAFKKLPVGTVESLLKPENKQKLVDILKYHVVSGRVYAADALKAGKAGTLLKEKMIKVAKMGEDVKVNNAKVVTPNIEASNGVIHVIDSVLLPPAKPVVGSSKKGS